MESNHCIYQFSAISSENHSLVGLIKRTFTQSLSQAVGSSGVGRRLPAQFEVDRHIYRLRLIRPRL